MLLWMQFLFKQQLRANMCVVDIKNVSINKATVVQLIYMIL